MTHLPGPDPGPTMDADQQRIHLAYSYRLDAPCPCVRCVWHRKQPIWQRAWRQIVWAFTDQW